MAAARRSGFGGLKPADLDAIRDATREAEQRTGGELVCVLVERCDSYPGIPWMGAGLSAIAASGAVGLWQWSALGWHTAAAVLIGALCSSVAGGIGMYTATHANVRTTVAAHERGAATALSIAFYGGPAPTNLN